MNFKNEVQRKKVMIEVNKAKSKQIYGVDKLNAITSNKKDTSTVSQKTPLILDAVTWSGCLAFPSHCVVIKGVTKVYELYNERKSLNRRYENKIDSFRIDTIRPAVSKIKTDEEEHLIRNLLNELDGNGIIDDISNATNIDKDIVEEIIAGTTVDLLHCIV